MLVVSVQWTYPDTCSLCGGPGPRGGHGAGGQPGPTKEGLPTVARAPAW